MPHLRRWLTLPLAFFTDDHTRAATFAFARANIAVDPQLPALNAPINDPSSQLLNPPTVKPDSSTSALSTTDKGGSKGGRESPSKPKTKPKTKPSKSPSRPPSSARCTLLGCPSTQVRTKKKEPKETPCRRPDGTIEGAEEEGDDDDDDDEDDEELRHCSSNAWRRTALMGVKAGDLQLSFGNALALCLAALLTAVF